ncbi:chemotaxis-specific protein-glutamate methyltransferase CheB [Candidatus Venteria ishoeyi]|uniref:protein-glutamate methylesterase n=1 Tax=Candidatus Venteria ishoeyi TaxID=1899563 RepID=A0A1H6FJE1_9GAMM|nr:chemotaxis-specific protein-glutamate methyltransferase CheB [Candidatus Venteria ishoeyi]MDM8546764.1 chemotaxis-specific protein-glutamate methyltransferase CheB [Candidatus Venteria ishoeyi]SEH09134.1 Chemotaxis response regulator protein-glutamate methylesterase of group 3 operon [Candidatus Venteria ishoeyi]SEH09263.1 Chemotaxis response regulator protein-glutamate methylesterase of group 3 operon [Candidatus Venteria ishoeyi]
MMRIGIIKHQRTDILCRLIQRLQTYEIAWVAKSAESGLAHCQQDPPDLILMELDMPEMNGVEMTRHIMAHTPCQILLMTPDAERAASKVFEAMRLGAKDVVSCHNDYSCEYQLLQKKLRILSHLQGTEKGQSPAPTRNAHATSVRQRSVPVEKVPLVLIGSSTGGPQALAEILKKLPENFHAAVIIIQHLEQSFSTNLIDWLKKQCLMPVESAVANTAPRRGRVYLAAGNNKHLIVNEKARFAYTSEPLALHYRPSVDIFFNSIAQYGPDSGIAVLLTGMGRDGAAGLSTLQKKGWYTIAQDQASSVVYGMPKAAKDLGAAMKILPLEQIASTLVQFSRKII